jgi:hypothetical protein
MTAPDHSVCGLKRGSSAAHFETILALIASGATVKAACASRPEFPSHNSLRRWAKANCRDHELRRAMASRPRPRTNPPRPRPQAGVEKIIASFDAIMARVEAGAPIIEAIRVTVGRKNGYSSFRKVIKKRTDLDARYRQASRGRQAGPNALIRGADYTEAEIERAVRAVHTIADLNQHNVKVTPGSVNLTHLVRRTRGSSMAGLLRSQLDRRNIAASARRSAQIEVAKVGASSELVAELRREPLYAHASSKVRTQDPNVRDDMIHDLIVAELESRAPLSRAEARALVAGRTRNYLNVMMSLDERIPGGEGDDTWVQRVTADEWIAA